MKTKLWIAAFLALCVIIMIRVNYWATGHAPMFDLSVAGKQTEAPVVYLPQAVKMGQEHHPYGVPNKEGLELIAEAQVRQGKIRSDQKLLFKMQYLDGYYEGPSDGKDK